MKNNTADKSKSPCQYAANNFAMGRLLHKDCITVTSETIANILEKVTFSGDQKVVSPVRNPRLPTCDVVGFWGLLVPTGEINKVARLKCLQSTGTTRYFDCEEDAFRVIENREYNEGDLIVIYYEGSKGSSGKHEFSNGHVGPEAAKEAAEKKCRRGILWKHAHLVQMALRDVLICSGGKGEKECYADV